MNFIAGYQTPENKRYYAHRQGESFVWKETREGAHRFLIRDAAERCADDKASKVEGYSFVVEVEDYL